MIFLDKCQNLPFRWGLGSLRQIQALQVSYSGFTKLLPKSYAIRKFVKQPGHLLSDHNNLVPFYLLCMNRNFDRKNAKTFTNFLSKTVSFFHRMSLPNKKIPFGDCYRLISGYR